MDNRLIFLYRLGALLPKGGSGRKSLRTTSSVRPSLRRARRKIRVQQSDGDGERLVREVTGLTVEKNL